MGARFDPETLPERWAGPVSEWATHLREQGRAESTVAGYALHVGWLARDLEARAPTPWEVTPTMLTGWLDAHTWAANTRRLVAGSLRSFYTWAVHQGRLQRSPLAGVPLVPRRTSGPEAIPVPGLWGEPVERWCAWMRAAALSAGTLHVRRFYVRQLAETYADPWAVSPDDLALWLSRADWAPETKKGARSAVRSFYKWAEISGQLVSSPGRDLAPVRIPRTVPHPTPDDAVREALSRADDRTRLVLALALFAGLRRAEIAGVHTQDVGPEFLRVRGKGGHERLIPLHPELAQLLRAELRRRLDGLPATGWPTMPAPVGGWLFPAWDQSRHLTPGHIGKLIDRTLPRGWTPHTLRHRFATQAYGASRDLRAVQELLGHASPNTTIRYAAVPDGALAQAVAGITLPT